MLQGPQGAWRAPWSVFVDQQSLPWARVPVDGGQGCPMPQMGGSAV